MASGFLIFFTKIKNHRRATSSTATIPVTTQPWPWRGWQRAASCVSPSRWCSIPRASAGSTWHNGYAFLLFSCFLLLASFFFLFFFPCIFVFVFFSLSLFFSSSSSSVFFFSFFSFFFLRFYFSNSVMHVCICLFLFCPRHVFFAISW